MTRLLNSLFAGLVDESVMLITVPGRRTGSLYTLPVQYAQDRTAIWVFPGHSERKTWWRNLTDQAPVEMRLRGHDVAAIGQAFPGEEAPAVVEEGLGVYVRRFPVLGRRSGVLKGGVVDEGRLAELAKSTVMVRLVPSQMLAGRDGELEGASEGRPATGLIAGVRRHPLGAFYALTFLLSWGFWVPVAFSGGHVSHALGLLGPMISAFVITALTKGRGGLRDLASRMVRWRVGVRWYLWALAPLAVAIAVAALVSLGPEGFPRLGDWERMNGFPAIGAWAIGLILVVNAFGEETGWRGFALPRFRRRHDELQVSFLLSIPWALWHLPTFFIDSGYRDFPVFFLPGFLVGIFAGAVVLTWMYEGARSSILIVALWHLSLNIGSATAATEGAVQAAVTMFIIVWSLVIARAWRRRDEALPRRSGTASESASVAGTSGDADLGRHRVVRGVQARRLTRPPSAHL